MTSRSSRELATYVASLVEQVGDQGALAVALRLDKSAVSRAMARQFSSGFLAAIHHRLDLGSGRYVQDRDVEIGPAIEDKKVKEIERLKAVIAQQRAQITGYRSQITALRQSLNGFKGALAAAKKHKSREAA